MLSWLRTVLISLAFLNCNGIPFASSDQSAIDNTECLAGWMGLLSDGKWYDFILGRVGKEAVNHRQQPNEFERVGQYKEEKQGSDRFNPGPWSTITVDYRTQLGGGGFGTVYLGHTADGEQVAVKIIHFAQRAAGEKVKRYLRYVENETKICGTVDHINLLQCAPHYELDQEKGVAYLVLEYCDEGSLSDLVQRGSLTKEGQQCAFYQTMHGLYDLHRHDIAHADIKPENILVQKRGIIKIGDYGLSKRIRFGTKICGMRGTRGYQAPELFAAFSKNHQRLEVDNDPINSCCDPFAADMWAAGVTYVVSRLSRMPWQRAESTDADFRRFIENPRQFLTDLAKQCHVEFSPEELDFILLMLERVPRRRITALQVLQNEWYRSLLHSCTLDVQSLLDTKYI